MGGAANPRRAGVGDGGGDDGGVDHLDAGAKVPLVIAHRGASGYRPEHTLAAYRLAVELGADYIEPDLVMTKDGVLVVRHEPEISGTTDVADRPEFASRKATRVLGGAPVSGWFAEDFTLAELTTLRARERLPRVRPANTAYDGCEPVPTYAEVLALRAELSRAHDRTVGIIPEIKHSAFFHAAGLPPEPPFVALTSEYGLNDPNAPMWLQAFELETIVGARRRGYRGKAMLLLSRDSPPIPLAEVAAVAEGIGPEKGLVIPTGPDGRLGAPTRLVRDAHAAGLAVIPWTFRNENEFLAADFRRGDDPAGPGRAVDEQRRFLATGIDGLFTDFPDTGVEARAPH